jgi:hypothetical protein
MNPNLIATPKPLCYYGNAFRASFPPPRFLRESLMQQRQLRLGDILDDYCPRERRVTNHAIVAMIGPDVKQTRCSTCDTEHEYKHARVPRQRRKPEASAALPAKVAAGRPKRVAHEAGLANGAESNAPETPAAPEPEPDLRAHSSPPVSDNLPEELPEPADPEEGPVHRPLIRATLPRPEGTPPPTRPAPEFTIRQPTGRQSRFRPFHQHRGASPFPGNRSGNTSGGGGMPRQGGGRPPVAPRAGKRHGPGRKRSK